MFLIFKAAFRGFMVVLAISLHAIFEGIAMGTLGKASVIWYLCFAIAAHKFIIAFCVGMQVCTTTHCRMRDKGSMFLSAVLRKLIFLCSF